MARALAAKTVSPIRWRLYWAYPRPPERQHRIGPVAAVPVVLLADRDAPDRPSDPGCPLARGRQLPISTPSSVSIPRSTLPLRTSSSHCCSSRRLLSPRPPSQRCTSGSFIQPCSVSASVISRGSQDDLLSADHRSHLALARLVWLGIDQESVFDRGEDGPRPLLQADDGELIGAQREAQPDTSLVRSTGIANSFSQRMPPTSTPGRLIVMTGWIARAGKGCASSRHDEMPAARPRPRRR